MLDLCWCKLLQTASEHCELLQTKKLGSMGNSLYLCTQKLNFTFKRIIA